MTDYNMEMALNWAYTMKKDWKIDPPLPKSLEKISRRAKFVNTIDIVEFVTCLTAENRKKLSNKKRADCWIMIAELSENFMPDIYELDRIIISLIMWSGCILAAKTIALQTREGPVTPMSRRDNSENFDILARSDPIFRAGVETGVAFKKLRKEKYSFKGLPERCFIKSRISFLDKIKNLQEGPF